VKSVIAIENVNAAIDQIAQTTLRKVVGQHTLDEAFGNRCHQRQHPPDPRRGHPRVGTVVLKAEPYDSPSAAILVDRAHAINEQLYGHPDQTPTQPEEFLPEHGGLFLVAYIDGKPVASGGYRRYEDADATIEIKRMYVEPQARRLGVAGRVLAQLESEARSAGYRRAILDTGSKQSPAHALYERAGYSRTAGFSIYKDRPGNRAYAKQLGL